MNSDIEALLRALLIYQEQVTRLLEFAPPDICIEVATAQTRVEELVLPVLELNERAGEPIPLAGKN